MPKGGWIKKGMAGLVLAGLLLALPVGAQAEGEAPETELPPSVLLEVENMMQTPELPNGCEATSLAIVLRYLGYPSNKQAIALHLIDREAYEWVDGVRTGPHPDTAYAGDPDGYGFYCFAPPVVKAANLLLHQMQAPVWASDITGADEALLCRQLADGWPVVVWKTMYNNRPATNAALGWVVEDGSFYTPYVNLHVVVLCGYDENNFYFCDPHGLYSQISRQTFLSCFEAMGSRALVISNRAVSPPQAALPGEAAEESAAPAADFGIKAPLQ